MKLSEDLEQCIIGAILVGEMELSEVKVEDFSKVGQSCLHAVGLLGEGGKPPYSPKEMYTAALDVFGADKQLLRPYVKRIIGATAGKGTKQILSAVRNKLAALGMMEQIANQLAEGKVDLEACASAWKTIGQTASLAPLATKQGNELVSTLNGLSVRTLFPCLHDATGGLIGMWTIGGGPAIGKSTLAMQLAIHFTEQLPVLYYDFENGERVILHRLGKVFKSVEAVRQHTQQLFIRESIKSLSNDLRTIGKPALIVIDSFQSIPTRAAQRRTDLDGWLGRFEALKKEGHSLLLISEMNRAEYEKVSMKGFKETGEIEYKSDVAIEMVGDSNAPELHIVKNRHAQFKGLVSQLLRDEEKEIWFKEISGEQSLEGL